MCFSKGPLYCRDSLKPIKPVYLNISTLEGTIRSVQQPADAFRSDRPVSVSPFHACIMVYFTYANMHETSVIYIHVWWITIHTQKACSMMTAEKRDLMKCSPAAKRKGQSARARAHIYIYTHACIWSKPQRRSVVMLLASASTYNNSKTKSVSSSVSSQSWETYVCVTAGISTHAGT